MTPIKTAHRDCRFPGAVLRSWSSGADAIGFLIVILSALCVAWPLMSVRWPPFVDYPEHVAAVGAIHGIHDAAYSPYFVTAFAGSQYLLFYLLADLLAYPFGVALGARLVMALSVAALPVAVAVYLRTHGRPAIYGSLASCVAIHAFVFWGFVNYSMGIAVALFALAALFRLVRGPTPGRAIAYGLLALATFYAHAQLYVWMCVASVVEVALLLAGGEVRSTWKRAGWAAMAATPSLIAMGSWLVSSSVLTTGEAGLRSGLAASSGSGVRYARVAGTVGGFWKHSFDVYTDGAGIRIGALFFGVAALLSILRVVEAVRSSANRSPGPARPKGAARPLDRSRSSGAVPSPGASPSNDGSRSPGASRSPGSFAPEVVLVLTILAWLFAPHSYRLIAPINDRFLVVALALLPVLGPTRSLRSAPRAVVAIVLLAATIYTCGVHTIRFRATDREMGDLDGALARTHPGKRLLGLIYDPRSAIVPFATYLHAHQYYQGLVGGMAAWGFVELPKSPVRYREGAAPTPFPPRFEWKPERFDWNTWGDEFDYFLIRTVPGKPSPTFHRTTLLNPPTLVFESERWKLFARLGP